MLKKIDARTNSNSSYNPADQLIKGQKNEVAPVKPEYAIEVTNVSKYYKLHHDKKNTLQKKFVGIIRKNKENYEDFWALRNINFNLVKGQTLGVVGQNGAGKSTLLKLVTGIIKPTEGRIKVNGRVSAMLELGTGFHPDLSARDNIFLNGAIYGFTKKQMEERYDRIVEFSELGKFIDTPIKHFSSGMYMRLAFSVAITVNPDILIIDEVLSVGDAAFGKKCYRALDEMKSQGVSMLFVSHSAVEVANFCNEVIYLSKGKMVSYGAPGEVLDDYMLQTTGASFNNPPGQDKVGSPKVHAPADLFSDVDDLGEVSSDPALEENLKTETQPLAYSLPTYKPPVHSFGTPLVFYPLPRHIRLLDNRPGEKALVTGDKPIEASKPFNIRGRSISYEGVTIPDSAQALVGTIAVSGATLVKTGFLTVYPGPVDPHEMHCPPVANINYYPGDLTSNGFTSRLGRDGTLNIKTSTEAYVVLDITGYYAPPGQKGLYFHPLPYPVRLLDGTTQKTKHEEPGNLVKALGNISIKAAGAGSGNSKIPGNARVLVTNITAVNLEKRSGYLSLYTGETSFNNQKQPIALDMTYQAGQTKAATITTNLGADDKLHLFSTCEVLVTVDVTGYFSDEAIDENSKGLLFYELAHPLRLLETRPGEQGYNVLEKPLEGGQIFTQKSRGINYAWFNIPDNARAVVGNCTAIGTVTNETGFVAFNSATGEKDAQTSPSMSSLSFIPGQTVTNKIVVNLDKEGNFKIYPGTSVHLIVDITGYFA